jgi:GT2 family glycosyltransferase
MKISIDFKILWDSFDEFPDSDVDRTEPLKSCIHSGNAGDILYSLPVVRELGVSHYVINLYAQPEGGWRKMTFSTARSLASLLLVQPNIKRVTIVSSNLPLESLELKIDNIDFNLDKFRLQDWRKHHLAICHSMAFGLHVNLYEKWIDVGEDLPTGDYVVVAFNPRYRSLTREFWIDVLSGLDKVVAVGIPEEFYCMQGITADFVTCSNILELARIIAGSRLFIGNPGLSYAIAEGLKVPRIVETCAEFPNAYPIGRSGYLAPHSVTEARNLLQTLLSDSSKDSILYRNETLVRNILKIEEELGNKNAHIGHLEEELQHRDSRIRNLEEELQHRDSRVSELEAQTRILEEELGNKKAHVGNLEVHSGNLERELRQRDETLNAIYTSHGWKLLSLYYRIRDRLLPANSARRKVVKFLWNLPNRKSTGYTFKTFLKKALRKMSRENYSVDVITPHPVSSCGTSEPENTKTSHFNTLTELIPGSFTIDRSGKWQDYRSISEKIETLHMNRLRQLQLKPKKLISVKENEFVIQARSLRFLNVREPMVSIVMPVYNQIKFTLESLLSIVNHTKDIPFELIIVDDGSTDETPDIMASIDNILYIRNPENLGFLRTCTHGAEKARGKYILFLNNDVQVTESWLAELVKPFEEFNNVGAVGPKVIYPDGRLQEAGVLINRDCSSHMIGLTDDPDLPRYNYIREVDYCSGVCFIIETKVFREIGGFDDNLAPAYCEDLEICLRLRHRGLRIIYNPKSVIVHFLSATSDRLDKSYKLRSIIINQQKVSEKWQEQVDELNRVRLIAFYLPQYHPIPENDRWWGKGFTEWKNVAKAHPNFVGHYQPHFPADLGFYDLRIVEVMEQQAELAKRYGINGFCYYYYWFGGKRMLETPLERLLDTNKPDIPFCLCWANENWSRRWDGLDNDILIGQRHSNEDDQAVIRDIIRYMRHPGYIRINGKPLLLIYRIGLFPDIKRTVGIWREVCQKEGIGEVYLGMVESFEHAYSGDHPAKYGFDASVEFPPHETSAPISLPGKLLNPDFRGYVNDYRELVLKYIERKLPNYIRFRSVLTSWDNTPRRQNDPYIFQYATPGAYQAWLQAVIQQTREQNFGDERIVFVNAWNEWAEGSHLEPDQRFGHGYLQATLNALESRLLDRGSRP